jgi:hypothetical protein
VPWTPRTRRLVPVLIIVASGAIAVTLVFLSLPIRPETSGVTRIGLQTYSFEAEDVFGPHWSNFSFDGVLFEFVVWCGSPSLAGASLCGGVSQPGGPVYHFTFWEAGGAPRVTPGPWETWVSPNVHEAVQFESDSGGLVHLLVAD